MLEFCFADGGWQHDFMREATDLINLAPLVKSARIARAEEKKNKGN